MPRLIAVVLLLTLALAPTALAEPPSRGPYLSFAWLDAFWGTLTGFFAPEPVFRAAPRGHGAMIIPSGIQAAPRRSGAMIIPSGVRSDPGSPGKSGLRGRSAVR